MTDLSDFIRIEHEPQIRRAKQRLEEMQAEGKALREALEWALDVLEISLRRIDTIDGERLSPEHYRIREAGLTKARAALAGEK